MSLLRPLVTPHPTPSGPTPMGTVSTPKLLTVGLPHPAAPQERVNWPYLRKVLVGRGRRCEPWERSGWTWSLSSPSPINKTAADNTLCPAGLPSAVAQAKTMPQGSETQEAAVGVPLTWCGMLIIHAVLRHLAGEGAPKLMIGGEGVDLHHRCTLLQWPELSNQMPRNAKHYFGFDIIYNLLCTYRQSS